MHKHKRFTCDEPHTLFCHFYLILQNEYAYHMHMYVDKPPTETVS